MAAPEGLVLMRISETGNSTDRAAGFTLIELVAVMTIVSILALAVIVGTGAGSLMGRERSSAAGSVARDLQTAVNAARDGAFHARLPHGLRPRPDGWQVLVRDRERGGWRPLGEGHASALNWVIDGIAHFPTPLAADTPARPPVVFAADGRATPFAVEILAGQERLRCATDGWEGLQCTSR